jgi:hypothetical protein
MVIDAIEGEQYVNFQEQAQAEGKCPWSYPSTYFILFYLE